MKILGRYVSGMTPSVDYQRGVHDASVDSGHHIGRFEECTNAVCDEARRHTEPITGVVVLPSGSIMVELWKDPEVEA